MTIDVVSDSTSTTATILPSSILYRAWDSKTFPERGRRSYHGQVRGLPDMTTEYRQRPILAVLLRYMRALRGLPAEL